MYVFKPALDRNTEKLQQTTTDVCERLFRICRAEDGRTLALHC
jgi:hypothetical protein